MVLSQYRAFNRTIQCTMDQEIKVGQKHFLVEHYSDNIIDKIKLFRIFTHWTRHRFAEKYIFNGM